MASFSDMQDLVYALVIGGGVLAIFGLGSAWFAAREGGSGGLGTPLGLVGLGLLMIGTFLGFRWGVL